MRDIAKEAYENCAIGATAYICPDPARGEKVENFQDVIIVAEAMQADSKIAIQEVHHESQTGYRLIDAIRFVRLS